MATAAGLETLRAYILRRRERLHDRYIHMAGKAREAAAQELGRPARVYIAISLETAKRKAAQGG